MLAPYKRDIGLYVFAHTNLCSYPFQLMILFCFNNSDIFSIAVHVFRNLFRKIFPLFGKMFSPSSYSGKMRWGRDCILLTLKFLKPCSTIVLTIQSLLA